MDCFFFHFLACDKIYNISLTLHKMIKKKSTAFGKFAKNGTLAPTRGFEPPTYRLGGGRSILLSYVGRSASLVILTQNYPSVNKGKQKCSNW